MEFNRKILDEKTTFVANFDRKRLEKVLNEIVKKTSYRINFNEERSFSIRTEKLPNGDDKYENIRIGHVQDRPCIIEGTEIVSPRLAYIIEEILLGNPDSLNDLIDYKDNIELIPIDNRIDNINTIVNSLNNFDFDNKIAALKSLKNLCEKKAASQYFDAKVLQEYYFQVSSIIKIRLANEKPDSISDKKLTKKIH